MTDLLLHFFFLLIGFGCGFVFACFGAAKIISDNKDLKDRLVEMTAERDRLKGSAQVIEIKDHRKEAADITGNYFTEF